MTRFFFTSLLLFFPLANRGSCMCFPRYDWLTIHRLASETITARVMAALCCAVILAGCNTELQSARDDTNQVIIRDPKQRPVPLATIEMEALKPSLKGFWQYGLLSAAAYQEERENLVGICPLKSRYVARWIRDNRYTEEAFPPPRIDDYGRRVGGLGYSVWVDKSRTEQKRVAITFRGTDFNEYGDWYSNARWITRFNPLTWDQYQQTRDLISALVPELKIHYGSNVEIIAVGHSLGGGLAQHAAYSSSEINTVYAFASSPVTGSSSLDRRVKKSDVMTFRVYESGEILSALRWISRRFVPLSTKDPDVKEARFNLRRSLKREYRGNGPISQHRIRQLTCDLICRVELGLSTTQCATRAEVKLNQ